MTRVGHIPPRRVVVWIPPGAQLIGTLGFQEALDAANRFLAAAGKSPLYRIEAVSPDGVVQSSVGLELHTRKARSVRQLDTLVVGGAVEDANRPLNEKYCQGLRRLAKSARRVVSICAGAFWLGEIGLLDHRRCTTHWLCLDQLAARFPKCEVQRDPIFVQDGPIFSSAGATAGIDLALHLIKKDRGVKLARAVARALVVFTQRAGGQSQFSQAVRLPADLSDRVRLVVRRVSNQPKLDHSVSQMAAMAGMSERHFARVFREQTGQTPAAFVRQARVEAAQRMLLGSDQTLAWIADASGFGSVESLRRAFVKTKGVPPSEVRSHFKSVAPAAS